MSIDPKQALEAVRKFQEHWDYLGTVDPDTMAELRKAFRQAVSVAGLKAPARIIAGDERGEDITAEMACRRLLSYGREKGQ